MAFKPREVVLVQYPYTVLSSDFYHAEQPDIVLGALTTNVAAATESLDYKLQDWAVAKLRFATAFKPVIVTLEPRLIVHHIGQLSTRDWDEIQSRIRVALSL